MVAFPAKRKNCLNLLLQSGNNFLFLVYIKLYILTCTHHTFANNNPFLHNRGTKISNPSLTCSSLSRKTKTNVKIIKILFPKLTISPISWQTSSGKCYGIPGKPSNPKRRKESGNRKSGKKQEMSMILVGKDSGQKRQNCKGKIRGRNYCHKCLITFRRKSTNCCT